MEIGYVESLFHESLAVQVRERESSEEIKTLVEMHGGDERRVSAAGQREMVIRIDRNLPRDEPRRMETIHTREPSDFVLAELRRDCNTSPSRGDYVPVCPAGLQYLAFSLCAPPPPGGLTSASSGVLPGPSGTAVSATSLRLCRLLLVPVLVVVVVVALLERGRKKIGDDCW